MSFKQETQLEKLKRVLAESRKWTLKFEQQEINYNVELDEENGLLYLTLIDSYSKKWINNRYRYNSMLFNNILLSLPAESDLNKIANNLYKTGKVRTDLLINGMSYFIDCFADLINEDDD